ncbi:nuclear transport factor 2 family protein [Chamaesiphon sp.]|uniref:nuclear transport factor 2 family protein n=1 Tax=Chamaesiphon sp. TaxID=2814140 RepID=UPI00359478E0
MKTVDVAVPHKFLTIDLDPTISIDGIDEANICEYFVRLNRGEFVDTANLFADRGCLNPPFEKSIEGREAIAGYLSTEAIGMSFCPQSGQLITLDREQSRYQIQGTVVTNYFTISVGWSMELNAAKEITIVEIKLLASMGELLKLRS